MLYVDLEKPILRNESAKIPIKLQITISEKVNYYRSGISVNFDTLISYQWVSG